MCVCVLACLCVFVRHWKFFFPTHHINLTTHVEHRQSSAAYATTAAVQICLCLCLCWVVLPGAWCLEEARTSVSNCETPPPYHHTSSLNLSRLHWKHRPISCSGLFHHGVMTDSDHRGAQSGQWKWSDGRLGPLPPLGSRSHDKFCLGEECACTEKQSVHPCRPNKEIKVMLMLRQSVSGHATADCFILAGDARNKWIDDVFPPAELGRTHHGSFKFTILFYVNMCHSFHIICGGKILVQLCGLW